MPPTPAHASRMRWPGLGAAASATCCAPRSCTVQRPAVNAALRAGSPSPSRRSAIGAPSTGVAVTPASASSATSASRVVRRRFARAIKGAESAKAAAIAGSWSPAVAASSSRIHRGSEAESSRSPAGRAGSPVREMLRSTAFAKPPTFGPPTARAASTASLTAAWLGTRSRNSIWYAATRSAVTTFACVFFRFACADSARSSRVRWRSTP